MNIDPNTITVAQLAAGFQDSAEEGVHAYGGKLDVRPPYQREFVYGDKERNAVVRTVCKGFPLNVMYWSVRADGNYEVIDGQQRTLSICQYVNGDFSIDGLYFNNLQDDQKRQILDYECMIYFCTGTDSERLDWFRTINLAGKPLFPQEIRNAVYAGPWTADAKRYFSKTGCAAYQIAEKYVDGTPIRQDYLQTAIDWHAQAGGAADKIDEYMGQHQHDDNATPLWQYFQRVIGWVKATFPKTRKEMKGVQWGPLYNLYKDKTLDTDKLEQEIVKLMADDDVTRKPGVYPYVLNRDERHLSIRAFTDNMKREAYERQKGICRKCKKPFDISDMEGDHIKPWHEGGKSIAKNCQMLCKDDNRRKSGK